MPELSKFERAVYEAIRELTKASPDGELTYTRILVCFLNGSSSKEIPWSTIQESKVYGRFPSANHLKVVLACKKLESLGYLTVANINNHFKYFLTLSKPAKDEKAISFSKKLSKYKKYLLDTFLKFIFAFCQSLQGVDHEKYYGIMKNPSFYGEYNWIWITDESSETNSLKIMVRNRPSSKRIVISTNINYLNFEETIEEIKAVFFNQKGKYNLLINRSERVPNIEPPEAIAPKKTLPEESDTFDFSFFDNNNLFKTFLNENDNKAISVSLSVSESSPYKYTGETIFYPKRLFKTIQGKQNFDFSFLKWKVIAWTVLKESPQTIQNILLLAKKEDNLWIVLSLIGRKVLSVINGEFEISIDGKKVSSLEIKERIFNKK